jgi:hypothetical protein
LDLAENALKIMHDHATDEHIQTMSKLILGEEDFAAKFARVQGEDNTLHERPRFIVAE